MAIKETVKATFQAGVEVGRKKGREEGMQELHDAIRTIVKVCESRDLIDVSGLARYFAGRNPQGIIEFAEEFRSADDDERYEPETLDVVLDPAGRKCVVLNTDTHYHVMYEDFKTHKWSKDAEFEYVETADALVIRDKDEDE